MTSQLSEKSPLTLAEFLQQPETKPPWQYIRGKPHQKSMPTGKPQLAPWQPTAHQIFACLTLT